MPADNDFKHDDKTSANGDNKDNTAKRKDICRDFLNNICNRGSRCKFFHPEEEKSETKTQNAAEEPYQFCNDFQNQGCHRDNCRYVHAYREDVDRYKRTGDITLGLARSLAALMKGDSINGIPLCKEFQNGQCARGPHCRFWHINREDERRKRFAGRGCGGSSPLALGFGAYPAAPLPGGHSRHRLDEFVGDDFGPPIKRTFPQPFTPGMVPPIPAPQPIAPAPMAHRSQYIIDLERRNAELTSEVESLNRELQREKGRYDDLMALFRVSQGQQSAQRSATSSSTPGMGSGHQQPPSAVPSLSGIQQQPAAQQWGAAAAQSNWSKYELRDWTKN